MKEQLKHLLEKWPTLYSFVAKIYGNLHRYSTAEHIYFTAERFVGTRAREREWTTRHCRKGNDWNNERYSGEEDEWVLSYWDSRSHNHRSFLLEKIAGFSPISSILEIGCNCGPNLYLIAQRFPGIEIQGIDINPAAIQKGNELFASKGISNVKLSVAKADKLGQFQDKSFDVVFTDAVLIYIGRDKIQRTIKEMVRVARNGLILVERHCFEPSNKDRDGLGIRYGILWQRDYVALLKQFVPKQQIRITKITEDIWPKDPQWQEAGAIIEATLQIETRKAQFPD
ncbi:MAG TPA: class I SAM-dependent methyltransferase [Dehalococcoidia bacterium]|nr:class I SAM-dependent methyltransferase [Dehalococcoidia bacterium]